MQVMKFCSEYGQALGTGNEKFCPNCGYDLIQKKEQEEEDMPSE
jgi:hypothetical protein